MIDYTTKEGAALYDKATKSLYPDKDDYFDLSSDRLMHFIDKIRARGVSTGWDIFTIRYTEGGVAITKDLLNSYGEIPLDGVREYAATIITAGTRQTQEDHQLLECLQNSVSEDATNTRTESEMRYCQELCAGGWRILSSGGGFGLFDSVDEGDSLNHVGDSF